MRTHELGAVMMLLIGTYGVGSNSANDAFRRMTEIARNNKEIGEAALRALDRAWLSCATPNQSGVDQDDDRVRMISRRR